MVATFLRVFRKTRYTVIAVIASFVFFTISLWFANFSLLEAFLFSQSQSFLSKIQFLGSMYGLVWSGHTFYSLAVASCIAVLSGINIALLTFYIKRVQTATKGKKRASVASIGGLFLGVFGVGCAACGSVILTALLSLFGVGGLLLLLPFKGAEFGIIAIIILLFSCYTLVKHIGDPLVCRT